MPTEEHLTNKNFKPEDVIGFAPSKRHWHGAGPTTSVTHIAIQEYLDGSAAEWM